MRGKFTILYLILAMSSCQRSISPMPVEMITTVPVPKEEIRLQWGKTGEIMPTTDGGNWLFGCYQSPQLNIEGPWVFWTNEHVTVVGMYLATNADFLEDTQMVFEMPGTPPYFIEVTAEGKVVKPQKLYKLDELAARFPTGSLKPGEAFMQGIEDIDFASIILQRQAELKQIQASYTLVCG